MLEAWGINPDPIHNKIPAIDQNILISVWTSLWRWSILRYDQYVWRISREEVLTNSWWCYLHIGCYSSNWKIQSNMKSSCKLRNVFQTLRKLGTSFSPWGNKLSSVTFCHHKDDPFTPVSLYVKMALRNTTFVYEPMLNLFRPLSP